MLIMNETYYSKKYLHVFFSSPIFSGGHHRAPTNAPVAAPPSSNFLVPPPMRKRIRGGVAGGGGSLEQHQQQVSLSPASNLVQRLSAADDSFGTPTFGMLPRQTTLTAKGGGGGGGGGSGPSIALKLDFSSPSLSVLSPCLTGALDSPGQPLDKAPVKQKRVSLHLLLFCVLTFR